MKRLPRSRRWLVGGLVALVLVALPLAWLLQEPVRQALVEPAAAIIVRWRNLYRSVPQAELWTMVVMLGALELVWSLARRAEPPRRQLARLKRTGRVGDWAHSLRLGGRASRLFLAPFRFLAVQIIAFGEQQPHDETSARLYEQTLPMPQRLQAFLEADRSGQAAGRFPNQPPIVRGPAGPLATEIEEIITILEGYLEVGHEE